MVPVPGNILMLMLVKKYVQVPVNNVMHIGDWPVKVTSRVYDNVVSSLPAQGSNLVSTTWCLWCME